MDVDDTLLSSHCHKKQKPTFLTENIIRINSGSEKRCKNLCAGERECSGWFFSLTETSGDPISVCLLLIFNKNAALKVKYFWIYQGSFSFLELTAIRYEILIKIKYRFHFIIFQRQFLSRTAYHMLHVCWHSKFTAVPCEILI